MKLLHSLFVLPLLAPSVLAGGLVPAQVDANARWIGHVDLQAFHDSQVYQAMIEADEQKDIERGLSELFTTSGIDLFRDVRSATVYGVGFEDEAAVAIIATTSSAEPALAHFQEQLGAKVVDIGGRACMEWKDKGQSAFSCLRSKPDSTDRLFVVSHSRDGIANALDVLDGKRASYATQPSAELSTTVQPGTFVFVAATGIFDQMNGLAAHVHGGHGSGDKHAPDLHGDGPESVIARLAQGVRVEIGEIGGRIFADVHLRTQRDEDAQKLQQIVQGLMALASFATEEPDVGATLGRWLKAVQVSRQESTLHLSFAYDLKTLIREVRALDAIEREKNQDKHEDGPDKK